MTKALLSRWQDSADKVGAYNLRYNKTDKPRKGPRAYGFIKDFVEYEPKRLEDLWNEVETRAPAAFARLDKGTVLEDPESRQTLLDFFSLHFVRSTVSPIMWSAGVARLAMPSGRLATIAEYCQRDEVAAGWYRETNPRLSVSDIAAATRGRELLGQMVVDRFGPAGSGFHELLEAEYQNARDRFGSMYIHIGLATSGEFCIGDAPVATYDADTKEAGLLSGVTVSRADSLTLPLGPNHVMSIATSGGDKWVPIDDTARNHVNTLQVVCAVERVYFRPCGDLEAELKAIRTAFSI